jgi:predicted DCC family thiol-disulfide oxidoreductase YuxK
VKTTTQSPGASPARPLLLYDGECSFCRTWIARWRHLLGERVEFAAYQDATSRLPNIPRERFKNAVHLLEPDGRLTHGAEAVFRSLARAPGRGWTLWLYSFLPGFAPVSEWCYRLVARHRPAFERLTNLVWGPHLVPPGETLTASIFLRVLGATYLIAFVSLWTQIMGLIGSHGILPAHEALANVASRYGPIRYWFLPTLAWLGAGDGALHAMCAAGTLLSLLVVVGRAPVASLAGCWALYLSLATVGQDFLWFQWDGLLLEAGFLALFLAPWRWRLRAGRVPPPSRLALAILRWLLFRLMFSSAAVKLTSGDPTWHDLSALQYHYQTQCLPPWTAWYMHQLPAWFQRLSAIVMFAIEGLAPFLIVAPRRIRFAGIGAIVGLQLLICLTGNYGFFNLLSLALCLLALDDGVWPWRWRAARAARAAGAHTGGLPAPGAGGDDAQPAPRGRWPAWILRPALAVLFVLSLVPTLEALRVPTRWMGPVPSLFRFVSPFRTVNRYGLFAVMTTRRPEIVIEGSDDGATWREYAFRWKPGDVRRRPGLVAPHMPRLDWQMWFAALSDYRREPWFLSFCERLLEGSPRVLSLLATDPFDGKPPRYLRALVYDYRFTDAATRRATGAWWSRDLRGLYCPVLMLEDGQLRAAPPGAVQP